MINADDVLLFVYEVNLIIVKPLGVKAYIKFLFAVYESKTDVLGRTTEKKFICTVDLTRFSCKYFQATA